MSKHTVPKFQDFVGKGDTPTPKVEKPKPVQESKEELSDFDKAVKEVEELANNPEPTQVNEDQVVEETKVEEPKFEMPDPTPQKVFEGYHLTKDKDEVFECNIAVEGTTLSQARARLVFDANPWNLTFYGKIDSNGDCKVPIRKGVPLNEGSTGKVRLEVIAEDQLFIGWESDFIVEVEKKLNVQVFEKKKVNVTIK